MKINESCKSPIYLSHHASTFAKALIEPDEKELAALPTYKFGVASSCHVEGGFAVIAGTIKILQLYSLFFGHLNGMKQDTSFSIQGNRLRVPCFDWFVWNIFFPVSSAYRNTSLCAYIIYMFITDFHHI